MQFLLGLGSGDFNTDGLLLAAKQQAIQLLKGFGGIRRLCKLDVGPPVGPAGLPSYVDELNVSESGEVGIDFIFSGIAEAVNNEAGVLWEVMFVQ